MGKVFTIDKVGWITLQPGNSTPREQVVRTMWAFVDFLQNNSLCNSRLASSASDVDNDEFSVRSDDLNELGMAVVKDALDRWHKSIDRGSAPEDTEILKKALTRLKKERERQ